MTTTPTPAERREALEEQVDQAHNWLEGQVYSNGGTAFSSTDKCRICGLERHYKVDEQNGVPPHHTYALDGKEKSLRQAAERGC